MTTLELYGCKQAPGVTTLALAFAAVLDGALLVEADPQGGDVSAMIGRPPAPGLLSAAAAGRHGATIDLREHVQSLPAGGEVLLAPSDPAQVAAGLATLGARLLALAGAAAPHVVVDRGRAEPSPCEVAAVLLCHPTVAGVEQARVRCEAFAMAGREVVLVLSPAGPYRADEVAAVLGQQVAAVLPADPRGATGLVAPTRSLRRSPLVRAATSLVEELSRTADAREHAW
jgi:hypothetical protein